MQKELDMGSVDCMAIYYVQHMCVWLHFH